MTILIAGPDVEGLTDALVALDADVVRVEGIATRESLDAAGLAEAHTLVLTDMDDASAIPVAKEANAEIRVVTYARESLPEFARGQADLAIDPALLSPDVVADELLGGA
ncbi:MAG: CTP synthetase [Haloquadratum sp.]